MPRLVPRAATPHTCTKFGLLVDGILRQLPGRRASKDKFAAGVGNPLNPAPQGLWGLGKDKLREMPIAKAVRQEIA